MRTFFLAFLAVLPLPAATIVTGGTLLNQTGANQLATWLGQGDLQITNIFGSAPATNASTFFHNAVDGKGPTFVLIQTNRGLVGGYDPVSWNSNANYNINGTDAGRTAFIFNLSTLTMLAQRLTSQATAPDGDTGRYQSFGYSSYGPAFGGGHDLVVNSSDLSNGYANSYSYGNARGGANVFGVSNAATVDIFSVTRVEAFTIGASTSTPEPATMLLCGAGLLALGLRKKLSSARSASNA